MQPQERALAVTARCVLPEHHGIYLHGPSCKPLGSKLQALSVVRTGDRACGLIHPSEPWHREAGRGPGQLSPALSLLVCEAATWPRHHRLPGSLRSVNLQQVSTPREVAATSLSLT